jgi:hypothetical protein
MELPATPDALNNAVPMMVALHDNRSAAGAILRIPVAPTMTVAITLAYTNVDAHPLTTFTAFATLAATLTAFCAACTFSALVGLG